MANSESLKSLSSVAPIITALVALVSVLVGALLNEFLLRKHRIENYSQPIFQKRLEVYEKMYLKLLETEEAANHVIESDDLSSEERHEIASEAILGFAEFCDQNAFYLDDEVKLHAVGTFIGIEDIPKQKTKKRKEELLQQHREKLSRAKEMIRAEAGLKELDRYFSSILKPDHSSELVEYYRSLKAEREKH